MGIPQSPENCPADRLRTRRVWHFLWLPFHGKQKKRADSSLMTATCPLIVGVSLSCFLLLSSLLLIGLQEPVDVLFCDLVVHHLLLRRAVLLIEFSLLRKDTAVLG